MIVPKKILAFYVEEEKAEGNELFRQRSCLVGDSGGSRWRQLPVSSSSASFDSQNCSTIERMRLDGSNNEKRKSFPSNTVGPLLLLRYSERECTATPKTPAHRTPVWSFSLFFGPHPCCHSMQQQFLVSLARSVAVCLCRRSLQFRQT